MNEDGYVNKRYILSFIGVFFLLLLFILAFFYFNIYIALIIFGVIIFCTCLYLIGNFSTKSEDEEEEDFVEQDDVIAEKIRDRFEDFSLELFYVYVRDVIDLLARSYSRNNIGYLNNFVGKDLIEEIKTKMESYASSGCTRMITGVNVRDCKLTNYYRASGFDYFELDTTISKIDCSVQNGVVINGDKDNGKFLDYKVVICRKVGDYTPTNVVNCPSCGTNSNNFNSGKCLNCGQLVVNLDGYYLIKLDEF